MSPRRSAGAVGGIRRPLATAALAGAALFLVACTAPNAGTSSPSDLATPPSEPAGVTGAVTVFAAASLRDVFETIGEQVEADNPGLDLSFSFAGSSDLVTQIENGAPADVVATADTGTMQLLVDSGSFAGDPVIFATNTLVIAVPPGNPAGVASLEDFGRSDLRTVVCAPRVPCGRAAQALADAAGVTLAPVSEQSSVTDVLGTVLSGEANAGIVYATDVLAADGAVEGIDIPSAADTPNEYPVAVLAGAPNPRGAAAFTDALLGAEGRAALDAAGFGAP